MHVRAVAQVGQARVAGHCTVGLGPVHLDGSTVVALAVTAQTPGIVRWHTTSAAERSTVLFAAPHFVGHTACFVEPTSAWDEHHTQSVKKQTSAAGGHK